LIEIATTTKPVSDASAVSSTEKNVVQSDISGNFGLLKVACPTERWDAAKYEIA
jgi:hypothetical protein